jgi:hypothetical protein
MWAIGAQAGSQAIVDARVLALALATAPTPERALEQYEAQRRPAMNAVTLQNRKFGPAIVMELAEQRAPNGFKRIEDVVPHGELADIARAYKVAVVSSIIAVLDQARTRLQPPGVPVAAACASAQVGS